MKPAIHKNSALPRKDDSDWEEACRQIIKAGREVLANWEHGDLALAVNRLRLEMDEVEHLIR